MLNLKKSEEQIEELNYFSKAHDLLADAKNNKKYLHLKPKFELKNIMTL